MRTNPYAERIESIEEVGAACAEWELRRTELDYEIDGIVIKVDSFDQQRRLGALHGRPRWARAFKWAPMTAVTRLNEIRIRVGRTGALNPWALLEPVEVGGVTISRATLHNEEDINRKDIRVGDDVIVQRAGDVIPQIVGPAGAHRRGTKPFKMPEKCPLCGTNVVKPEGEVMHRCPNRACPSRGLETLNNWVMAAADIDGVGEQTVWRLWDLGLVRSVPELYRLTVAQLLELEGFGEISATNSIEAIQASKAISFSRPLRAEHPRRRLGDRPDTRTAFRKRRRAHERDPGGARRGRGHRPGAGGGDRRVVPRRRQSPPHRGAPRARPSVRVGRGGQARRRAFDGPGIRDHRHARELHAEEAQAALEALGAKVAASPPSKTTGLIVGEEPGKSKLTKAQKAGVPILTEQDLLQLLGRS